MSNIHTSISEVLAGYPEMKSIISEVDYGCQLAVGFQIGEIRIFAANVRNNPRRGFSEQRIGPRKRKHMRRAASLIYKAFKNQTGVAAHDER